MLAKQQHSPDEVAEVDAVANATDVAVAAAAVADVENVVADSDVAAVVDDSL